MIPSTRSQLCAALVGCALAGLTACVDADERPATWSYLHAAIVQPNCTSSNCHSELAETAGVNLQEREAAFTALTGRACEPTPGMAAGVHEFVVPYDPTRSKLMYQLRGEETLNMPPDVPLPDVEIELFERWILEGAPCD